MVIDSHQHFWIYEPVKHEWIDDSMSTIRKNFLPEDLKTVYTQNSIEGCIAVQADQTIEETDFLIDLAAKNEFIKGVVGWVDLRAESINRDLEHYSKQALVKGFRHVVQGESDPNFVLRPHFLRGISALKAYNYTYDILVFPHQLGAMLELVKRFPNQQFVIDHAAKPYIKDGFYDGWASLMTEIGKHPNVYCKLSGFITEADYKKWTPVQIQPYLDLVLEAFGPGKLLFGSDWPVCLVAGNYKRVKALITNFIANLSASEQAAIMGKNAIKFYNIN